MTSKSYLRQVMEIKPQWLMEGTSSSFVVLRRNVENSSPVAPHYFSHADLEQLATGDKKMPKAVGSSGAQPA